MRYCAGIQIVATSEITVEADSPREALDKAWQEVAKQGNMKVLGGTVSKAVIQDFFVVSVEDENGKITEFDENGKALLHL